MATDVTIPPLGESITEAGVGQWLKQPGDPVKADEPIVSLETDKVAVEVPSPVDGVMGEQLAKVGETVAVGTVIARIEAAGAAPAKAAVVQAPPTVAAPAAPVAAPAPAAPAEPAAYEAIAPAVRRLLGDYNIDPASVAASGKDGRLTKGDVLSAIDNGSARLVAAAPQVAVPAAGQMTLGHATGLPAGRNEERVRMTRLRQTIARRLKEAQNTAAMLTTFNDVDMSAVMAARDTYRDQFEKKHGVRLGFMSFFVHACTMALRDVPSVNAAIDGDEIVYRDYADIGVAVSSPGGLVVPVLRDADKRSFADTEKAIGDFGRRARDGQQCDDDEGGLAHRQYPSLIRSAGHTR